MSAEFEIVLHIAFAITMAIAIAMIVVGIIRLKRKIHFPKYTVNATVVSKRAKARRHGKKTDTGTQIVTDTFCYVTFKESDMNILELKVSVNEYMALNKGESGKLTFQGAKFLGFEKPNGEIVYDAAVSETEESTENKKGKKRKQNGAEDNSENENKKSNKKQRKSKVKAEVEGIGENDVPELEAGVENGEIQDTNSDSEDGEAESVASDV